MRIPVIRLKRQILRSMHRVFCITLHIYSLITKKRSKRYDELAKELPAMCQPLQDGGIPLRAFPNDSTSKLAALFSTDQR